MSSELLAERASWEVAADPCTGLRVDDVQYAVLEDDCGAGDLSAESGRLLAATFAHDRHALHEAGCSDVILCGPLELACKLAGRPPITGCSLASVICEGRLAAGKTTPRL